MTTTRERLARIPDLAAEVWLTRDAPNPGPEGPSGRRTPPGSRPPLNVATIDALRPILDPEDWHETPLWHLVCAVRVVADDLQHAGLPVPSGAERPTYASECGWLLAVFDEWQSVADLASTGFVADYVALCHAELSRLAREPRPVVLRCLVDGCGGRITVDDAGIADACENGHLIDRHEAVRRVMRTADLPLSEIAPQLGVEVRTLQRWAKSGLIQRTARDAGVDLYRFEYVYRVHVKRIEWRIGA